MNKKMIISDIDDTIIFTAFEEDNVKKWIENAKKHDSENRKYSTYLKEIGGNKATITKDWIDDMAINPQNDIKKILEINEVINQYVNKNWIIGCYVDIISKNVNSQYRLSYNQNIDSKNIKKLNKAKEIINQFNKDINIESLIKTSIPTVVREGNYCFYSRTDNKNKNTGYTYTYYPLSVVIVSDYDINGEPVLLLDISKLKSKLSKAYLKLKKNNKPLFFKAIEDEIKNNYPPEVYKAYKDNEQYAKLDYRFTGIIRVNNQNKKYGLSPIFRALDSIRMLEQFDDTDEVNAKANAKKIIIQLLRKEIMGLDYKNDTTEEMIYAHENLMSAFKQKTVIATAPAWVEDVKYVEPSATVTNKDTVESYTLRALSTLGINFLMGTSSTGASIATIALDQLMKFINSITEQLERILERTYRNLLIQNGLDSSFAPKVTVIDSKLMEQSMKQDLAKLLYTTFNVSYETCLSILGIDINDEKIKREKENTENINNIFTPRATTYNSSGNSTDSDDNGSGRPMEDTIENIEKQTYDKGYNDIVR